MIRFVLAAALLAMAPTAALSDNGPAAPADPAAAAAITAPAAPGKPEKLIDSNTVVCKSYAQTGTRLPKKVCLTKAEWFYEHTSAKDALRNKHELDPRYK